MKVQITENGQLVIAAESALEAYALGKWRDDNRVGEVRVNILIDPNYKNHEVPA